MQTWRERPRSTVSSSPPPTSRHTLLHKSSPWSSASVPLIPPLPERKETSSSQTPPASPIRPQKSPLRSSTSPFSLSLASQNGQIRKEENVPKGSTGVREPEVLTCVRGKNVLRQRVVAAWAGMELGIRLSSVGAAFSDFGRFILCGLLFGQRLVVMLTIFLKFI